MNPPEYKPTPEYPSSSVITSRTPVQYNGTSNSMMEMQKVSNMDLSKSQMYNYNSTSALTKQVQCNHSVCMRTCLHTCVCVCLDLCMCLCLTVCLCKCLCVSVSVCLCLCMCLYLYIFESLCVCTPTYIISLIIYCTHTGHD